MVLDPIIEDALNDMKSEVVHTPLEDEFFTICAHRIEERVSFLIERLQHSEYERFKK